MLVVLFTKWSMDADKPFPVANIPSVRFIRGPKSHGRIGNIKRSWDPERLL